MSAPEPLLVVGAGGFARETAAAVAAVNAVQPRWQLLGLLDDDPALHGVRLAGAPVLGPLELVDHYPHARVVVCTGRPDNYVSRALLVARLGLQPDRCATVVHPYATVGAGCVLGAGTVLLAHADLTVDVEVGRHVAVMPQVVLTHDVAVGDFATLASGVRVGGACRVGTGAYLGAGAVLRQGVAIGPWSLVGMSSAVLDDVPAGRTWFGSPARDRGPAPLPVPVDDTGQLSVIPVLER
jgi:sugar O-acyltransferase (sialic acid O-acetyltransferase NeuD family)